MRGIWCSSRDIPELPLTCWKVLQIPWTRLLGLLHRCIDGSPTHRRGPTHATPLHNLLELPGHAALFQLRPFMSCDLPREKQRGPFAYAYRVCVRTLLSPFQGLLFSHFSPRLAPWALFLRRFAAKSLGPCSTLRCAERVLTHTLQLGKSRIT